MSNFCHNCGARVAASRFCGDCGAALSAPSSATGPAAAYAASGSWPTAPARTATAAPAGVMGPGRVDVAMLTLFSAVTLGIMWLVWAYQEVRIYRRVSGLTHPNLENYFWTYVGLYAGTAVMSIVFLPLGLLVAVAGVVVGALFLDGWMKDRDAIAARYGTAGALTSRGGLMALWIGSNVATLTVVGTILSIPLMIILCVLIFQSHNRVVEAAQNAGVDWR